MIITRTPYRISFFGGGTDHPQWYRVHGGAVLSTAIDKYCYVSCRNLPPFFEHKHRIVYSHIETVNKIDEIQHPVVRECLKYLKHPTGVEIHHDGDLPARSGIGTSSSFTVGLLNALHALQGRFPNKQTLALQAIEIEQKRMRETVGSQDQVAATYGGFNHIQFLPNEEIVVQPVKTHPDILACFKQHLMLFFTGFTRMAAFLEKTKLDNFSKREKELHTLMQLAERALSILSSGNISEFGPLLHESWRLKQSLAEGVTTEVLDDIYQNALAAGAAGGKILGAGGGGFLLLFVPPERQQAVRDRLHRLLEIPFNFDTEGSKIIFQHKPQNEGTLQFAAKTV
ncbi:MAG: kinase [Patescibacteria group bacterium]